MDRKTTLFIAFALSISFVLMTGLVNAAGCTATILNPTSNEVNGSTTQVFEIQVGCPAEGAEPAIVLDNVSLESNFTGTFLLNQTNTTSASIGFNNTVVNFTQVLPDGTYIWRINVSENTTGLGNWNITANQTFTVDSTSPTVAYSGTSEPDGSMSCPINLRVIANDRNLEYCEVTFNGVTTNMSRAEGPNICTSSHQSLSDGSYNVTVRDRASNTATTATRTYLACATGFNPAFEETVSGAQDSGTSNTTIAIVLIALFVIFGGKKKTKRKRR